MNETQIAFYDKITFIYLNNIVLYFGRTNLY